MSSGKFWGYMLNYQNMFFYLPGKVSDNRGKSCFFGEVIWHPTFKNKQYIKVSDGGWAVLPFAKIMWDDYEAKEWSAYRAVPKVYDPLHPYDDRDPRLNQNGLCLPGSSYGFSGRGTRICRLGRPRIAILTKAAKSIT